MKVKPLYLAASILLGPVAGHADDLESLRNRIDQLEGNLKQLSRRLDDLGPAAGPWEVRLADPVFIGAGAKSVNSLSMDNPTISCPAHSFVSAVQVLKTGNTVTQLRYACRGIE